MSAAPLGSTEVFFSDFFPAAYHRLRSDWPAVWQLVQPGWLAAQCPEHEVLLGLPITGGGSGTLRLRNPALLPLQLGGVAVGLWGLCRLGSLRHTHLRLSLLFFALMNLSSIACHALAKRGTAAWHAALLADVVFTGCSSLCLLLAQVAPAPTTPAAARAAARSCYAVCLALLAACAANLKAQLPWVPEAAYLGTTAAAASATAHRLLWQWVQQPAGGRWRAEQLPKLLLAAASLALMLLCLPLDPLLCAATGLGTVQLLFLGSGLGFAAIVWLAAAEDSTAATSGSKRQGVKTE